MATTKKSTKKPTKKTAKKRGKNKLHTLKAIRKTTDNWIEAAKDYNERYVLKPFETTKDFVEEMQKDPLKTIEGLIDDGKDFIKDVRKDPRKVFDDFIDGGKNFYKGLQKDTRQAFESIVDKRKDLTDKIPMVNTIEDSITKGLMSVPDRLNLPNKKDVESLAKTVKTLNRKINALSKAQTA